MRVLICGAVRNLQESLHQRPQVLQQMSREYQGPEPMSKEYQGPEPMSQGYQGPEQWDQWQSAQGQAQTLEQC